MVATRRRNYGTPGTVWTPKRTWKYWKKRLTPTPRSTGRYSAFSYTSSPLKSIQKTLNYTPNKYITPRASLRVRFSRTRAGRYASRIGRFGGRYAPVINKVLGQSWYGKGITGLVAYELARQAVRRYNRRYNVYTKKNAPPRRR